MKSSPIPYVRDAKLSRGLLNPDVPHDPHDIISGVNTQFLVDHGEPLEALDLVRESWNWPLGELPDGYEFLLIVPVKPRRPRSRSLSRTKATS